MSRYSVRQAFTPFVSATPGADTWSMLKAWVSLSRDCAAWPQFKDRRVIFTHSGRVAIALLCKVWGLYEGDEVLVPSYNCGSEIDALLSCGLCAIPYRIRGNTEIDLDDIAGQITPRTRLVYVTHYFGWPQPMRELVALCRERRVLCVEDCALALFSKTSKHWLGQAGDAAIYSFPKSLGVPDGGALVLRNCKAFSKVKLVKPAFRIMLRRALSLVKNRSTRAATSNFPWISLGGRAVRCPEDTPLLPGGHPEMLKSHCFDESTSRWALSRLSRGLVGSCDWEQVVKRRRANYLQLDGALRYCPAIEPLFSHLPEGLCPLYLPVLVSERDTWFHYLRSVRIMANRWWRGYHPGLRWNGFPEACALKDRILSLPIHQDLDENQIGYIGEQVKRFGVRL